MSVEKLCAAMIRFFSVLVPGARRPDWVGEWNAEIAYYCSRAGAGGRHTLLLRCMGAGVHALWLGKEEWRLGMLKQDLVYGFRALVKKPGFTAIAILVLALGIGANTAIFSVVYSVLLRPLPFENSDKLVMLFSNNSRQDVFHSTISPDDLVDFRAQNQAFESVAGVSPRWGFNANLNGNAEQIFGFWVSSSFFKLVGVQPIIGRAFTEDEDRPGALPVVVLSNGLWRSRFGGDISIVGKTISIGVPAQVIGVMPAGFHLLEDGDLWVPLEHNPIQMRGRGVRYLNVLARLKPGVSLEQAEAEMSGIAQRLEAQYPDTNTGFGVNVIPLHREITGEARPTLIMLLAAVGLVLLIACANVANLMLVRAADRYREVAVRTALGANRIRLIRQFLTESVLLSLAGAVMGLALAYVGIRFLLSLGPDLPRLAEIRIDISILGFTLLLALLSGIAFGLAPAFLGTRANLNDSLKDGSRGGSAGRGRQRLRSILVVSEVALALVLLVACGLLIRSFVRLLNVDPGYTTERLVVFSSSIPGAKYPQPVDRLNLYYQIEEKLKAIPGVAAVGAISRFPLSGVIGASNITSFFMIEERPVPLGERPEIDYRVASTEYFDTLGIPLKRGRKFDRRDASQVVILNEAAADKFWPGQDPVGKRIHFGADTTASPWLTVVGVVGNVRHMALDVEPRPEVYRPYPHNPLSAPFIGIRTQADPETVIAAVRSEIRSIETEMPINITTIEQMIDISVAQRRFSLFLVVLFAVVALVLAMAGIYGVMSYSVTQRTREIGLRMALGAQSSEVLRMIVWEGFALTIAGVAIGIFGALMITRVMSAMLFGIAATDPLTYASVSVVLLSVAMAASYAPARRATKVDPNVALRDE